MAEAAHLSWHDSVQMLEARVNHVATMIHHAVPTNIFEEQYGWHTLLHPVPDLKRISCRISYIWLQLLTSVLDV